MAFYEATLFPQWKGSALIGGLQSEGLVRVTIAADGSAAQANRWHLGHRIRDVAVATDGAVWVLEDGRGGRLLRLTPGA
jgi:glucose/arabinose dehydrogenase